jgi:hypothetical protein
MRFELLKDIERNLTEMHSGYLDGLLKCWGIPCTVVKQLQDTHSDVYGTSSGRRDSGEHFEIEAIIVGDEFEPATSVLSGSFNGGVMYAKSECVNTADHIHINGDDGKTRIFIVTSKQSIGNTQEVFSKFTIAAKGTRPEESYTR